MISVNLDMVVQAKDGMVHAFHAMKPYPRLTTTTQQMIRRASLICIANKEKGGNHPEMRWAAARRIQTIARHVELANILAF